MPSAKPAADPNPPLDFEGAMERLESIVGRMEGERLPLKELLSSYEEGVKLVQTCTRHLTAAEQRIEMITRQADGEPKAVPLAAAAPPPDAPPAISPRGRARPAPRSTEPVRPSVPPDEVSLF